MAPHSTENVKNESGDVLYMDKLLDKAAHLEREQEMFLRDLESFKARLELVERKLNKGK